MYIAFTSHIRVVLHLRIEIMKETDLKKCLSMFTSFPSTTWVISLSNSDSVPKLFRKHLFATTKLTVGNPCAAVFLQSVQMFGKNSSACSHGQVAIPNSLSSLVTYRSVQKSDLLSLVMSSWLYKKVVLKLQKEKANLMETCVWFWGRRMSTAARLVEVCQFARHNSYPEKFVLLILCIFSVFSLPMIFFNFHSCFFFQNF